MKKRNNKVLILTIIGILFVTILGIFILNYSKDDASFSILEKKWINDNKRQVIDISVFNDVPVYGKNGKGVIFDFLDNFTDKHGISFNKVSYLTTNNNSSLRGNSFRVINSDTTLADNDLLLYKDYYVLVGRNSGTIDTISDMGDITVGVLSSDLQMVSDSLTDNNKISYVSKNNINEIKDAFASEEIKYAIIPYNMNIDFILKEDLHVLFHLTDISKNYVLTVENKTFSNIMRKYFTSFKNDKESSSYKNSFLDEYFLDKEISEAERASYNSNPYNVGYTTYMPYEDIQNKDVVGTLYNYFNNFEEIYDTDLNFIYYDSIEKMKNDFSNGNLDAVFGNFDIDGVNVDTIRTSSLFKEKYVVISRDVFNVISIKSLLGKEVSVVNNSYLHKYATSAGIKTDVYDNTDNLIRGVSSDAILLLDKDTYDYYKVKRFGNYNELFEGVLPYDYTFYIRDVNKNTIFAKMFSNYVETVNYNSVKFNYNTTMKNYSTGSLFGFIIAILGILLIVSVFFIMKKKKKKESIVTNNDKLKYIDAMTSLKNRNYLNLKIKEWDNNTIYPQGFVIVDLNNIKFINDNHGHEEGDTVIKKAASILIVNQEANTDIVRTDGNEFLIYMVGYDEQDIVNYTRRIYKELKNLPYGFGASIGYSMILDDVKTVDDAINEATIDMRNKKESSRL